MSIYRPKIKTDTTGTTVDLAIDAETVKGHAVETTGVSSNTTTLPTTAQVKSYVDAGLQTVTEIAEGKTANYVISDATTGTNVVNSSFNSSQNTVTIALSSNKITDVLNNDTLLTDLKVGDIVSVTQTDVPDRWVGSITASEITFYALETKLTIDTVVTAGSTNPVSSSAVIAYAVPYSKNGNITITANAVSGGENGDISINSDNELEILSANDIQINCAEGEITLLATQTSSTMAKLVLSDSCNGSLAFYDKSGGTSSTYGTKKIFAVDCESLVYNGTGYHGNKGYLNISTGANLKVDEDITFEARQSNTSEYSKLFIDAYDAGSSVYKPCLQYIDKGGANNAERILFEITPDDIKYKGISLQGGGDGSSQKYDITDLTTSYPKYSLKYVNNSWTLPDGYTGNFYGNYIWTDGTDIYYSADSHQYIFDKSTSTWSNKTWTLGTGVSLSNLFGDYIWTDGNNIYCSGSFGTYILDKSTSTWSVKTWGSGGATGTLVTSNIWTDGKDIYYDKTSPTPTHWIFNKQLDRWEEHTWSFSPALENDILNGNYIWTDGNNIYLSIAINNVNYQYVLDKLTSTWIPKIWYGLDVLGYEDRLIKSYIWTDGDNIYLSGNYDHVLDKATSTWRQIQFSGNKPVTGSYVWSDGKNIYYDSGSSHSICDKNSVTTIKTQTSLLSDQDNGGGTSYLDIITNQEGRITEIHLYNSTAEDHEGIYSTIIDGNICIVTNYFKVNDALYIGDSLYASYIYSNDDTTESISIIATDEMKLRSGNQMDLYGYWDGTDSAHCSSRISLSNSDSGSVEIYDREAYSSGGQTLYRWRALASFIWDETEIYSEEIYLRADQDIYLKGINGAIYLESQPDTNDAMYFSIAYDGLWLSDKGGTNHAIRTLLNIAGVSGAGVQLTTTNDMRLISYDNTLAKKGELNLGYTNIGTEANPNLVSCLYYYDYSGTNNARTELLRVNQQGIYYKNGILFSSTVGVYNHKTHLYIMKQNGANGVIGYQGTTQVKCSTSNFSFASLYYTFASTQGSAPPVNPNSYVGPAYGPNFTANGYAEVRYNNIIYTGTITVYSSALGTVPTPDVSYGPFMVSVRGVLRNGNNLFYVVMDDLKHVAIGGGYLIDPSECSDEVRTPYFDYGDIV